MDIVLLPVLLERGMFFEQFWCKTEILFKHIFMQNSNQSTSCTLMNLLSQITLKRVYMAYLGQKIISNFLTKPGFHMVNMVNINRYIFGHKLGPTVCYHEFNALRS